MAEDHRENVDNALMAYLYAGPYSLIALQDGTAHWGWELLPEPNGLNAGNLQGEHDSEAAALRAGIAWIRYNRPDLVRECEREAREGERYRAAQRRQA